MSDNESREAFDNWWIDHLIDNDKTGDYDIKMMWAMWQAAEVHGAERARDAAALLVDGHEIDPGIPYGADPRDGMVAAIRALTPTQLLGGD